MAPAFLLLRSIQFRLGVWIALLYSCGAAVAQSSIFLWNHHPQSSPPIVLLVQIWVRQRAHAALLRSLRSCLAYLPSLRVKQFVGPRCSADEQPASNSQDINSS